MHARDFADRLRDRLQRERNKKVEDLVSGNAVTDYATYRNRVGRLHQIDDDMRAIHDELKRAIRMDDDIDEET